MKQNRNNKSSIAYLTACGLLAVSVLTSCSSSEGENKDKDKQASTQQHTDSAAHVATFSLTKGKLSADFVTPGELTAFQQVDLYAKIGSFVKKLNVDIGSEVKAGQLLATMEAPELTSQLSAALSKAKSQEAIYIASKANYDRVVETAKTPGTISQNDIDQADARQKSDLAQWEAAKAAYNEVQANLQYLEVRAPFNGIITARNINPGAYVAPSGGSSMPMFTLQEQKHLRLIISVPEAYTGFLTHQDKVKFTVRAFPNQTFEAKVNRLAGALDTRLRSEHTEMDVYTDGKLLPGMVAEVNIPMPSQDSTFIVPSSAVVNGTERIFVVKKDQSGIAQWVDVKVGRTQGGKTEIYTSELNEGDQIVTAGSEERRNGQPLK